jgi:transposase
VSAGCTNTPEAGLGANHVPRIANPGTAKEKKSLHASERDTPRVQQARHDFQQAMSNLDLTRGKFIDESGINLALSRLYGRAPRGERALGSVPINYGTNLTLLGALGIRGVEALMTVEGATDGDVFRVYVEQILCPTLRDGDLVVMDNLGAHKVAGIGEAIEARGAQLRYLPPYSPDLSPIEQCWSKLKTALRAAGARTRRALERALKQGLSTITESDAVAWFAHCGYRLN